MCVLFNVYCTCHTIEGFISDAEAHTLVMPKLRQNPYDTTFKFCILAAYLWKKIEIKKNLMGAAYVQECSIDLILW